MLANTHSKAHHSGKDASTSPKLHGRRATLTAGGANIAMQEIDLSCGWARDAKLWGGLSGSFSRFGESPGEDTSMSLLKFEVDTQPPSIAQFHRSCNAQVLSGRLIGHRSNRAAARGKRCVIARSATAATAGSDMGPKELTSPLD